MRRTVSLLAALILLLVASLPANAAVGDIDIYDSTSGLGYKCYSVDSNYSNLATQGVQGVPGPSGYCDEFTWNNYISRVHFAIASNRCWQFSTGANNGGVRWIVLGPLTGYLNAPASVNNQITSFFHGYRQGASGCSVSP